MAAMASGALEFPPVAGSWPTSGAVTFDDGTGVAGGVTGGVVVDGVVVLGGVVSTTVIVNESLTIASASCCC